MAKNPVNPEFPHLCTVRRVAKVTSFSDDKDEEVIYEGVCRHESSANIRTFKQGTSSTGQIVNVDYRVSIPGAFPIRKGDIATVDFGCDKDVDMVINQSNVSSLVTERYPEGRTEFYYSSPQV